MAEGSAEVGLRRTPGVRPARLITYAWGDKYVDELLSLTLAAALAPNNLPAIVKLAPTDVVLLIQRQQYSRVATHPTILRMRRLCPVYLVGLDDLLVSKDKYGMTLTYALHRGMRAFGADMTETNYLFLNADFVVADGSLRNALAALMRGERLVAAPSYCLVSQAVRPELSAFVDPRGHGLTVSSRALARLALRHLHNTVKGKTLSQSDFHLAQMDQFYWRIDRDTLIGHQMPAAIVGMRPERALEEPNAFWDHGLIEEFCPEPKPCMLGDSDDFLMIELREGDVAADQIVKGPVNPREAGERMVGWVTPYQFSFVKLPLALHAKDLPASYETGQTELTARVADILSYAPRSFPSHRDHPQWNYHLSTFMDARHRRLSLELGAATETDPPDDLTPIDRAWWRLDGARKRHERGRAILVASYEEKLKFQKHGITWGATVPVQGLGREESRTDEAQQPSLIDRGPGLFFEMQLPELEEMVRYDQIAEVEIMALEQVYATTIRKDVISALVPHVKFLRHAGQPTKPSRDEAQGRLVPIFRRYVRLAGYHSSLRHARATIANAIAGGARDVLIVTGSLRLAEALTPIVPGLCASVSSFGVQSGNFPYAIGPEHKFDLCLWELHPDELSNLHERIDKIAFCMKPGAVVVAFCSNSRLIGQPMPQLQAANGAVLEVRVERTSRPMSVLTLLRRAIAAYGWKRTVALVVQRLWATRPKMRKRLTSPLTNAAEVDRSLTSLTVIGRFPHQAAAAASGPASAGMVPERAQTGAHVAAAGS